METTRSRELTSVAGVSARALRHDDGLGLLESCTIVTRPPTADLVAVHDRIPVLLLNKNIDVRLNAPPHQARAALGSWPPRILTVTSV